MKRLFAGLFIVLTACTIQGQTTQAGEPEAKCTLTKAPELRGLRLGMSLSEVKARFPELTASPPDEFGYTQQAYIRVDDLTGASKTSLDGVSSISFDFLDERLIHMRVGYRSGFTWNNVDDFIAVVSDKLNLPRVWEGSTTNKQLQCQGFNVFAYVNSNTASVGFYDPLAGAILKKRKAEKEAKLRRAFKL